MNNSYVFYVLITIKLAQQNRLKNLSFLSAMNLRNAFNAMFFCKLIMHEFGSPSIQMQNTWY
jgi:hypothetical protein